MEGEAPKQDGFFQKFPLLHELSASDDLIGFKRAVEEEGRDIDEPGLWYGRRMGSKKMGFEERTPLLIAAMFGSKDVLSYIIESGRVDVNRASGSDGATALHCAAAGGSPASPEVVKLLLGASADTNSVDANGNRPGDLILPAYNSAFSSRKKLLEILLKGSTSVGEADGLPNPLGNEVEGSEQIETLTPRTSKEGAEKKEYPVDLTLPDIKNGIYGTDEFRMYTFKVKPCSRAYSHDWTECPFVHPGENARRRDPRKYHYSCVPCPEFRKGSTCRQGDNCEYAHGIFECWLHPAQYRTRLCKDETNCTRRVCFFAHKPEELRPLYASTGSAMPSPRSYSASASSLDMGSISPLGLGSPSIMIPPSSTPPLTPTSASSPVGGAMWQQPNIAPPTLQLPGSRLKTALSARNMDLNLELIGLENHRRRWQQQLIDELSGLSSPSGWKNPLSTPTAFSASADRTGELNRLGGMKPTNLEDIFGSLDPSILPQLQGISLDGTAPQLQSPTGMMLQNINQQHRSSYPISLSSSPVRASPSFGMDPPGAASAAFAKRSQSFIERTAVNRHSGFSSPASSATTVHSNLSDWGSPDGKLHWGIQGEELNKLRKSASFGFRNNGSNFGNAAASMLQTDDEPDVSWVQSLVKDTPPARQFGSDEQQQQQCHLNTRGSEMPPAWVDQMYSEQEQMVA
ncbi:hypothetical protein SLE2022_351390 [Rubroshorea leprosula]